MKKCCKCKVEKSINAFSKNKNAKDGYEWMCKECRKKRNQTPKVQLQRKQWRKDNAEYMKQYIREHYKNNKQLYFEQSSRWQSTPEGKVGARIRGILSYHLKLINQDKTSTTQTLVGYSPTQLKEHLDKQGMDWNKHQIDHKVPITWFKKDTPLDIVHDLRNLQPLTELENKRKKNYYSHPVDKEYYEVIVKWIKEKYVKKVGLANLTSYIQVLLKQMVMKHNYTLAKERELKLVECLNNNLNDTKFNQIANYINNELGYNFDSFSHSGSIQTEPGDILGYVGDEIIPIEIKILDTAKSTLSHGGVSGDFFKICSPKIEGYKEFEFNSGVEQQRWDMVSNKLNVTINNHKEYVQYEKQVKSTPKLKEELVNLTNEYKIIYLDNLVNELKNIPQELLLKVCNSIFKGFRKPKDILKYNIKNNIIEVQVGNFLNDDIIITHKTFLPKTQITSIKRNGYALQIEFESGSPLKFPLIHGNGYQGSGRTRSFKCMFNY